MSTDVAEVERRGLVRRAEGGLVAELELDHDSLLLTPSLRRAPDVSVSPEYTTLTPGGRPVAYVTAYGSGFEAFETALEVDPTVAEPELVDRYADRRVYRVVVTTETTQLLPLTAAVDARVLDRSCSRSGWLFQLHLPDRDALAAFNERCSERDISVSVSYLRLSDDGEEGVLALTQKQEELLSIAYEEGYFEVPRGISQDELAARLDVSKSAVSQRLRRALGQLCSSSLVTTDDGSSP
ncbi:helix-turn-helix domain-containing protein [Halobacteria archaeon AArc-dxtr1]|nr:helix-turn-helix domain-containing protein [Halobacteria archaeon AArc-dxtr1]